MVGFRQGGSVCDRCLLDRLTYDASDIVCVGVCVRCAGLGMVVKEFGEEKEPSCEK